MEGSFSSISKGEAEVSSSTSLTSAPLVPVQQRVFGIAEVFDDQADLTTQVSPSSSPPRQIEFVDEFAVDALFESSKLLSLDRGRRVCRFGITTHPDSTFTALSEATPTMIHQE